MDWIQALNSVAACLHGAQAIVVISLIAWLDSRPQAQGPFANNGQFPLQRFAPVWTAAGESHLQAVDAGVFDVRSAILAFFVLSCAAHSVAAVFFEGRLGAVLHYAEYALSASVALCAIAVEAGIRDVYTLQAQFVLTFATMVLGMAGEFTQTPQRPVFPCALFHVAGWVTCLAAYAPIMDVYLQSADLSALKPPSFVSALVFVEFALFACFGFTQTYALVARAAAYATPPSDSMYSLDASSSSHDNDEWLPSSSSSYDARALRAVEEHAELAFIVLSLTAKTTLCWIVLSPLLV